MRFKRVFVKSYKVNILNMVLNFIGNLFFTYCMIVAIALILFSSVTTECKVVGASMQPTFNTDIRKPSDIVYVNKYDRDFQFGDIVVVNMGEGKSSIIKRVIGVGGDLIDIVYTEDGYKLEINGKLIEEDYLLIKNTDSNGNPCKPSNGNENSMTILKTELLENKPELFEDVSVNGVTVKKLRVPEGEVFVMGDNRHVSQDSTHYGTFKLEKLDGIVERARYSNITEFRFYWDYIVNGEFFNTISNCF